jgi:hypothetical protein
MSNGNVESIRAVRLTSAFTKSERGAQDPEPLLCTESGAPPDGLACRARGSLGDMLEAS